MAVRITTRDLLERLHEHWPEVSSPEGDIALAVIRLNGMVRAETDRILRQHDLTPAAFEVLVALRSMPPPRQLTPTELYRVNLLSSGGLSKILKSLSTLGLIAIASNRDDGRSKIVKLTAKGKRLVEAITKRVSAQDRLLFGERLDASQIDRLRSTLLETLAAFESDQLSRQAASA